MSRAARQQHDEESGSTRTCIVMRAPLPREQLIRFVLDPEGRVTPDIRAKLPGRGVWVSASKDLVAQAVRKGAFARGFKKPVVVSPDLAEEVEALLLQDARQSLALANKAGLAMAGAFQVETALAKGQVAVLLHASDGSQAEAGKMRQALRRMPKGQARGEERGEPSGENAILIDFLSSGQIGLALGRTNVIHAALKPGAASEAFARRCARLQIYLTGTGHSQEARPE